jgi:hypothetical protein
MDRLRWSNQRRAVHDWQCTALVGAARRTTEEMDVYGGITALAVSNRGHLFVGDDEGWFYVDGKPELKIQPHSVLSSISVDDSTCMYALTHCCYYQLII